MTAAPKPTARKASGSSSLEGVLNGLANMQLGNAGERQVLGERNNLVNRDSPAPAKDDAQGKDKGKSKAPVEVIELSSDDDDDVDENAHARPAAAVAPAHAYGVRLTKAARLTQLAREIVAAPDNKALARLVRDFVAAMQENRSKMLTKEGFAVVEALRRQLGEPGAPPVAPLRTSRSRSSNASADGSGGGSVAGAGEARQGKMNKLWRLGVDVRAAGTNAQLAGMVGEFGAVINKSSGRTVTREGFAFLNQLAARIEALA